MHVARTRILDPIRAAAAWTLAAALALAGTAGAQDAADDAPLFSADELDELVAPIALYPDDLVAIVLPAATYPLDVVEAARFLDELEETPSLAPDEDWDDSIVALLNYPEVLRMMDEDLDWTWDLGEAFLNQQADVFDAIQRFRIQAREAGNLASDERVVVSESDGAVRITPANPEVIYVPYYEPREVIVHHHHAPIRYYPRPYPVYYYPYPAGYSFWSGYFWGVTTAFVIGWHTHHLHAHHHLHIGHPYHRHHYYEPFYVRRSVSINIVNIDRDVYVWQPRHHRIGGRPGRVVVTREGAVRGDYGSRRYVSRGNESRRTVSSAERRAVAGSGRTIGGVASSERQTAGSAAPRASLRSAPERGASAAGTTRSTTTGTTRSAASESRPGSPSGRTATSARGNADASGRVTTREGIVSALRDAGQRNAAPASNRTIGGAARSAEPSGARGTANASRGAPNATRSEPSRSRSGASSSPGASTNRSTTSPSRNIGGASRTITSPSRSAPSPGRDAGNSSRGTTRSIGGASPGRGIASASASSATRSAAAAPTRGSSAGGASRGTSRSAGSAGRSSTARSAAGAGTSRTRTSR